MSTLSRLIEQDMVLQAAEDFAGAYQLWWSVIKSMPKNDLGLYLNIMERFADAAYRAQRYRQGAAVIAGCLKTLNSKSMEPTIECAELLQKLAMLYYLDNDLSPAICVLLTVMQILELDFENQFDRWQTAAKTLAMVYERCSVLSNQGQRQQDDKGSDWQLFLGSDDLIKMCAA